MTRDQQSVSVGIVGGGLVGKEVAVAFARWAALIDHPVRPELTHVCDIDPAALAWFDHIPSVQVRSTDYHDLLGDRPEVLYIAVRHDLHEQIYVDAIEAGASLLAEKPFGIDLGSARAILAAVERHPESFVRCSSELPFFPGAQAAISRVTSGSLGRIIEVHSGFSHSSDLDAHKLINWKRQARYCGANGVLNDLGMHVLHVPLRLGLGARPGVRRAAGPGAEPPGPGRRSRPATPSKTPPCCAPQQTRSAVRRPRSSPCTSPRSGSTPDRGTPGP